MLDFHTDLVLATSELNQLEILLAVNYKRCDLLLSDQRRFLQTLELYGRRDVMLDDFLPFHVESYHSAVEVAINAAASAEDLVRAEGNHQGTVPKFEEWVALVKDTPSIGVHQV